MTHEATKQELDFKRNKKDINCWLEKKSNYNFDWNVKKNTRHCNFVNFAIKIN